MIVIINDNVCTSVVKDEQGLTLAEQLKSFGLNGSWVYYNDEEE